MRAVHHVDLWVREPITAMAEWTWLFTSCGWAVDLAEEASGSWKHPDGTYAFLERSPDPHDQPHDRLAPGVNHLAFCVRDRVALDALRDGAEAHGWRELYAERYPYAGGPDHTAIYLENSERFEVEVVVEP
jgi:hypothetical protein